MDAVAVLAVFVPLIAAAVLAGLTGIIPRIVADMYVIGVSIATVVLTAVLFERTGSHRVVYWLGGWHPTHGAVVGIDFAVDRLGAGAALLVAVLTLGAVVFAWRELESGSRHFHVLMLLFQGGMIGFALTGDLFLLFVFFELMSVAAYALAGLIMSGAGPLQGAINFAVVNSAGSFALLLGIALVYARTGSLNFGLIGAMLSHHRADGLVAVALTLLLTGMLTKAAIVPFHFWLADAHADAPTPACMLFSGIMVELGLFTAARMYWTMFSGVLSDSQHAFGLVLMALGIVSALVGGVMCFAQHHLKRLLAYSTISHAGVALIGIGLMSRDGLAGSALYVAGHGLVKAALFIIAGIVLHRTAALDEVTLRGRGRALHMWPSAILFAIGGLALAGLPPFGLSVGKSMIDEAGKQYGWLPWVCAASGVLTGGAVLRVAGRVFAGWGPADGSHFPADDYAAWAEDQETDAAHQRTPLHLILPAVVLLAGGLLVGVVPSVASHTQVAAAQFVARRPYAAAVLTGHDRAPSTATHEPESTSVIIGIIEAGAALALAAIALLRERISHSFRQRMRPAMTFINGMRALHSGKVGDYVAWFVFGLATFGGLTYVAVR